MATKTIRMAAVQLDCSPGQTTRNLEHATGHIEQAAAQGAHLVLLPELMPGGYVLTEALWNTAERSNGKSVDWLKATAHRLGIYCGMSFLEAEGTDFYNSFVLASPDGQLAGRVRKSPPASVEAYFYRGGDDRHYIDTDLGRIGVAICYENLLYERLAEFHRVSVDLALAPSAAATPTPAFPMRRKDALAFDAMLKGSTAYYARCLGVPAVMANRCGPLVTPLPGGFPSQNTRFPGLSAIVDSDGSVKTQLGAEEDLAIADVCLDPERKVKTPPARRYGRWSMPVPWYGFLWPLSQKMGERAYQRDTSRSGRAQVIAGSTP